MQWADGMLPHSGTLLAPGREAVRIMIRTRPRLEPIAPAHEPAPRAAVRATATIARREFLVLSGLAFLLLGCGIYLTRAYVMDDALITLRYSFNLARHGQAIWNQADLAHPSQGYTTVL